jgi:hypothetical protein
MHKSGTATAQATTAEPPRIKKFRRDLIKAIPRVPNNKASLQHMEGKHLTDLLIDYINWRSRYVGERPRTVSIAPAAQADLRSSSHAAAIRSLLDKVERGDDLTPHLSIEPHTRGYAPAALAPGAIPDDRWSDKDFLLNIMGFHHFHLGTTTQKRGHVDRTDELIFAEVDRDNFKVIAIFDHDVFDKGSAERMRLWAIHESIIARGAAPGSVVVSAMIATSGHAVHVVRYAQDCARVVRDIEPKLDDPEYVRSLYNPPEEAPAKSKLSWGFRHLDLAIYDAAKPVFMILRKGWN